jgi:predicted CopG family antitoxin
MSKIDDLREKYPSVSQATFNKFVNWDQTPTKKYVPFLLKTWVNKKENGCPTSTDALIRLVKQFDELLPYIDNKDIYNPKYSHISQLFKDISLADEIREEKQFIKEDNCETLIETDEYIFVRPTTIKGSLKYGSNTKWCTVSKKHPQHFNDYTKNGLLVYLIDKNNTKNGFGEKIAFYSRYSEHSLDGQITLYNTIDSVINHSTMINYGWSFDETMKVLNAFRIYHNQLRNVKKAKDSISNVIQKVSSIDFKKLHDNINFLGHQTDESQIKEFEETIKNFNEQMKKIINYGYTKTES